MLPRTNALLTRIGSSTSSPDSPTPAETAKAGDQNDRKINNHPIRTMLLMGHRDINTAAN
jgi:hypothetical protein